MSLNGDGYLSEGYFETDIGKDFSKATCRWLYTSDHGGLSNEYSSEYILLISKPSPEIKAMISDFEDANKDKSDLMMRDFYAHFSFDYTEISRSAHADNASNISVSTEEIFRRNAAHLYVHNSEELASNKPYNPELIRKAARREGSFDEMISNFEDANKGIQRLKMSDFYTYFGYDDFKEKFSSINISNLTHNVLTIVKPADRKNPCLHLYKKGLTPDMPYDGKKIRMMFAGARLGNNISMLDEFEKINKDKNNLTMEDLYNFNAFTYKYSIGKIFSRMTSNLRSDIKAQVKNIQNNTGKGIDIRDIPLNLPFLTKSVFIYFIAISLGLYSIDGNKISDFDISGKHQNILKKYSASIDNIYNSGIQVIDMDFLASLNDQNISVDDIRGFQEGAMSLLDELRGINLESQSANTVLLDIEGILSKYTSLFDTKKEDLARKLRGTNASKQEDIMPFLEQFGSENQQLEDFREAILNFHRLLIEKNIKNPEENNVPGEPIVFWRKEQEIEPREQLEEGEDKKTIPFKLEVPVIKISK